LKPKEVPRLDEYFAAEAEGIHPFDRVQAGSPLEDGIANVDEIRAEKEREQLLYKRELLGRLMGQRLSAA